MARARSNSSNAPTLRDVAEEAGVSTATVSRTLNTPGQVNAETRERVNAAVQALGYAPNFNARALVAKRTNTIGAVIPTMENAIFARGIQAFQEELGLHGITLLIASSSYRADLEAEQIRTLVARGADGLLLIGYHRSPDLFAFLEKRDVPALVAWAHDPEQEHAAIGFDNAAAMADLTRAVLERGHHRIGVISAPTADNDRARCRVEGAYLALREAGLDPADTPYVETPYGFENGADALRELLARAPDVTAVMCGNDVLAIGALRAAREMGLRVPEDISITGFDDIDIATLAEPSLTTVHVPHREMGRRAAQMLLSMLAGGRERPRHELHTSLAIRRSLGPVREDS
jgi:LacI family transcriptional regulator